MTKRDDPALLAEALAWRDRPAHPDLRGLPTVNVPALGRLRKAIPEAAATRALAAAYGAALRLSRQESLLRKAGVESVAALREQALADCDARARTVARQSGWLAGGSGAALGVAGAAGLVADAPALLVIALRAVVRVGVCYGEEPSPALAAALFALASADTDEEKRLAWQAALTAPAGQPLATPAPAEASAEIRDAAIRDGLERAAEREFAKQALTGSLQKLTTTLVQRFGVGRAAGLVPLVGAVVGGAVNLRFVYLLGEAARMVFIARRLRDDGVPLDRLLARTPLSLEAPAATRKLLTAPKPGTRAAGGLKAQRTGKGPVKGPVKRAAKSAPKSVGGASVTRRRRARVP